MKFARSQLVSGKPSRGDAEREVLYELLSGLSGLLLALFMWGHVVLVGSILTGRRGFDWMAMMLEDYYIAQPTVVIILILFLGHAVFASRKIPAQLRERRRLLALSKDLRNSGREHVAGSSEYSPFQPHVESMLWIWQVRTGLIILVLGSFHLVLLALDVFTPLFGAGPGIESATSLDRVGAGLWLPYAILLLCVEFHASVGLYRLAVKWGAGIWLSRATLYRIERLLFWGILALGTITLLVLAGWLPPPLAFLLDATAL
jgi:fumarate reductase subunit C